MIGDEVNTGKWRPVPSDSASAPSAVRPPGRPRKAESGAGL